MPSSILTLLVISKMMNTLSNAVLISEPVALIGEGEYNLNVLKEIQVTDSFMGLDQNIRKCQNGTGDTQSENNLLGCSGLIVSSFIKSAQNTNLITLSSSDTAAYQKYMKWSEFPLEIKGNLFYWIYIGLNQSSDIVSQNMSGKINLEL